MTIRYRMRIADEEVDNLEDEQEIWYLSYENYYTIALDEDDAFRMVNDLPQNINYGLGRPPLDFQQYIPDRLDFINKIWEIVERENMLDRIQDIMINVEDNKQQLFIIVNDDIRDAIHGILYTTNMSEADLFKLSRKFFRRGSIHGNERLVILNEERLIDLWERGFVAENVIIAHVNPNRLLEERMIPLEQEEYVSDKKIF